MGPFAAQNLWAITCYFNPIGYRRRLENYHIFRQRLKLPLVAVELSFDEKFHLVSEDADILVQLHSSAVLWQKERLLNVALNSLPASCDKVAWLDCDILFENEDWVKHASRALDEFPLVHLFQERNELPSDFTPDSPDSWTPTLKAKSVLYQLATGEVTAEEAATPGALLGRSTSGLAWASSKDSLQKFGLYDACIIGGGDKAILSAALGVPDHFAQALQMNPRRTEHFLSWAEPYFNSIRGRVGHIPGRVFHLWHGNLEDRRHRSRHQPFSRFDFDPYTEIALDSMGCWRWNSEKPEIHAFVKHYFESRREDGI